jgi:hypothetical protein
MELSIFNVDTLRQSVVFKDLSQVLVLSLYVSAVDLISVVSV